MMEVARNVVVVAMRVGTEEEGGENDQGFKLHFSRDLK